MNQSLAFDAIEADFFKIVADANESVFLWADNLCMPVVFVGDNAIWS